MSEALFVGGLGLISLVSTYLFIYNFRKFNLCLGGYFLGFFFLLVTFHALSGIFIYAFLDVRYFITNRISFFMFYGVFYYLFLRGGACKMTNSSINFTNALAKHLIAPVLFVIVYFVYSLIPDQFHIPFFTTNFNLIFIIEGGFIVLYAIKSYRLLMTLSLQDQRLRLHLLSINTILLFVGILLVCFYFLDVYYFSFYKIWSIYNVLSIVIYFTCIRKSIDIFLTTPDIDIVVLSSKKSNTRLCIDIDFTDDLAVDSASTEAINKVKYSRSKLSSKTLTEYGKRINKVLVEHGMYLQPDFSLEELSNETKISKHHLGQFFSTVHNKSFSRFINELRIAYLLQCLNNNVEERFTVNDLLAVSPFKSRASFFRNFKDITGFAPSDYLKNFYKD